MTSYLDGLKFCYGFSHTSRMFQYKMDVLFVLLLLVLLLVLLVVLLLLLLLLAFEARYGTPRYLIAK